MCKETIGKNITSGNLIKGIVLFAIPLFISTFVQTLFTTADTAVVRLLAQTIAIAR